MPKPSYDIIVFGATSFVGQILTRYMLDRHGVSGGEVSWAIAGRSQAKLDEVKDEQGAKDLPTLVADAADEAALQAMCAQASTIISTVGPYALYGSPLVKICAETGTDYCDLTGEVQWIRKMITEHEAAAKKSGARIVHCCGFDSIPSDLGVFYTQQQAKAEFGAPASRIKMRVRRIKGGASGGTVASLMNVVKEASRDSALRKELANPYSVAGKTQPTRQPSVKMAEHDEHAQSWLTPFVMAAINTRIVHRSNAVAGYPYGQDFVYDEAVMTGGGFKGRMRATTAAAGLGGFMVAAGIPPTRWLLEKVVPKPGEGPSPAEQQAGMYDLRFFAIGADGKTLQTKVYGDRDPGYGSTAKMLGEAGVCLALDCKRDDTPGGFWTPATAFGDALIKRLEAHAGLSFERID